VATAAGAIETYLFLRDRITIRLPESRANAATLEVASISGTTEVPARAIPAVANTNAKVARILIA
jgi:hypothetical protein